MKLSPSSLLRVFRVVSLSPGAFAMQPVFPRKFLGTEEPFLPLQGGFELAMEKKTIERAPGLLCCRRKSLLSG